MSRPGLVDLRDLVNRYAWEPRAIERAIAALRVRPEGAARSRLSPPPVLLAIVPYARPDQVTLARGWLEDARYLTIVRAHSEPLDDDEAVARGWAEAIAGLNVEVDVVDWTADADLADAVARAVTRACDVPDAGDPPPRSIIEHPPGRSFVVAPLVPDVLDLETVLTRQLVSMPGQALLHTQDGIIDLADPPPRVERLALDPLLAAAAPDGRHLVRGESVSRTRQWNLGDQAFETLGQFPVGFDGHRPVAWTGHRMATFFLYLGRHGPGFLSATDHDFPCGSGRKLYGYANNDPRRVDLAPDLSMLAAHFEHDVLITAAVPVRWRAHGAFDVADFPRDPGRALLFTHELEGPCTVDLLDEDARDAAPTLVPGASSAARYAVDLTASVYRITTDVPREGVVALAGGPGGGFAVFDDSHREVRRGTGRLLGGWFGHATVAEDGALWREELATGARRNLAPLTGVPLCAVPLPWTRNVVVVVERDGARIAQLV